MIKIKEKTDFYIVKVKIGTCFDTEFQKEKGEYTCDKTDQKYYDEAGDDFYLLVIGFNDKRKIEWMKIAYCEKVNKPRRFKFKIFANTESKLKIENFINLINVDINSDFKLRSYLYKEYAVDILYDFYLSLIEIKPLTENNINKHSFYNSIAQNSDNAFLMYKQKYTRDQYQRDKERIIHSKASRRLVDKAQIFTSTKGDHYRTRMTHTLEVAQIARGLARMLKLNEDLTEAIALGHDLGHTPFGHQGEKTLDLILQGKENYNIIKNINDDKRLQQRFKHNYQSLRVLTLLENKYAEYEGLNLSYQVMEGILKHTNIFAKKGELEFDLHDFFRYSCEEELCMEQPFSYTLEGQVVAIADEIAQRSHDIDDAFKSRKLNHDSFIKYSNIKKAQTIVTIDKDIQDGMNTAETNGMIFIDKDDMYRAQLSSNIIRYFMYNVVEQTKKNLENIKIPKDNKFKDKLVEFSSEGESANKLLNNLITKQVINSPEVAQFDKSASRVIYKLFKYYYENPLCLETTTLTRIYKEMRKENLDCIELNGGCLDIVQTEVKKIIKLDLTDINLDSQTKTEYLKKRKILVRCIADHISGMTDNYAINEFHKLYSI